MASNNELIIYLEPDAEYKAKVDNFLKEVKKKYGPTTANKYGCHVTVTGFFHVNGKELFEIINLLDSILKFNTYPELISSSLLIKDSNSTPIHLLLPVKTPEPYHIAIATLADQCQHIVKLRVKKINHVSLVYWDEPEATKVENEAWQERVSNGIITDIQHDADAYFKSIDPPTEWHTVLYKRVIKGQLVGEHHVFEELARW